MAYQLGIVRPCGAAASRAGQGDSECNSPATPQFSRRSEEVEVDEPIRIPEIKADYERRAILYTPDGLALVRRAGF